MNLKRAQQRFLFLCDRFKVYPEHESIGLLLLYHMRLRLTERLPEALTYLLLSRYQYERDLSCFDTHEYTLARKCIRRKIEYDSLPRLGTCLTDKDRFKLVHDGKWVENIKTEEFFMQVNSLLELIADSGYGRHPMALKGAACWLVGKDLPERRLSQSQLKRVFGMSETTLRSTARVINRVRRSYHG